MEQGILLRVPNSIRYQPTLDRIPELIYEKETFFSYLSYSGWESCHYNCPIHILTNTKDNVGVFISAPRYQTQKTGGPSRCLRPYKEVLSQHLCTCIPALVGLFVHVSSPTLTKRGCSLFQNFLSLCKELVQETT